MDIVASYIKKYETPTLDEEGNVKAEEKPKEPSAAPAGAAGAEKEETEKAELKQALPLGEGVLSVNLGVPLVVLCTKSEAVQSAALFNEQSLETFCRQIRTSALLCENRGI